VLPHSSKSMVAPELRLPIEAGSHATTWLLGHSHNIDSVDLDGISSPSLVGYTCCDTACPVRRSSHGILTLAVVA
jgi:hypothetical protein